MQSRPSRDRPSASRAGRRFRCARSGPALPPEIPRCLPRAGRRAHPASPGRRAARSSVACCRWTSSSGNSRRPGFRPSPRRWRRSSPWGIERRRFPKRVYGSKKGGRTVRPFGWKMPVAFGGGRARFAFVDTGGETHDELLSWGAEHAPLWSALAERGMRVELVAVSLSSDRLTEAKNILGKWKECGLSGPGVGMSAAQMDELRVGERALASLDEAGDVEVGRAERHHPARRGIAAAEGCRGPGPPGPFPSGRGSDARA